VPKIDDLPKGNRVKIAPVITTEEAKVIIISGAGGDTLAQHKVNGNGLLLVKKGTIRFSVGEEHQEFTDARRSIFRLITSHQPESSRSEVISLQKRTMPGPRSVAIGGIAKQFCRP
jgi:hypothetical protein